MKYYTAGRADLQAVTAEKRRFGTEIARAVLKKRRTRGTLLKPCFVRRNPPEPNERTAMASPETPNEPETRQADGSVASAVEPAVAQAESVAEKGVDASPRTEAENAAPKSKFRRALAAINKFLDELDEEEPEPEPEPEKPIMESIRDFIERCRDPEKRVVMLKEFGEWCWTMFFRGTVFFFLFVLTIWATIWALDFSENHRIKFYPPDETVAYLTEEHEALEAKALELTPQSGKLKDIPLDQFAQKFLETVKPIKVYADEYGVYFMTSKGWYNGEHGIFIARDEENMPPDLNWGLIEGRIYTYAIYD